MSGLSHLDESGKARMVNISDKASTERYAVAKCIVKLSTEAFKAVRENQVSKGDVLATARIGAIQAGKRTSELIPLCHNIPIDQIEIDFELIGESCEIAITAKARTTARTGIEMEAMTSAALAGLIIYDMCKAMDKSITITSLGLIYKSGGRSGEFRKDVI
jgi:cyclic pyranopterin monophosphate synthase